MSAEHDAKQQGLGVRCPSCGGLVASDAEWCGQCYSSLAPEVGPVPGPRRGAGNAPAAPGTLSGGAAAVGGFEVAAGRASWDCPVCGERNLIEAAACGTCQTPFARLFEDPVVRPEVEPRTAAMWSLAFAGLGHWKTGYRADGVARMILFVWTLGTVLLVLTSRSGQGGLGSASSLFVLYLGSAIAVYTVSAVDAYRIADGSPQLVSSRVLLWTSAALVLVSIALATMVTLPAARG